MSDNVKLEQANTDVRQLAKQLKEEDGKDMDAADFGVVEQQEYMVKNVRSALLMIFGAVGILLIVACATSQTCCWPRSQHAMVLLVGAGLLGKSFYRLLQIDHVRRCSKHAGDWDSHGTRSITQPRVKACAKWCDVAGFDWHAYRFGRRVRHHTCDVTPVVPGDTNRSGDVCRSPAGPVERCVNSLSDTGAKSNESRSAGGAQV